MDFGIAFLKKRITKKPIVSEQEKKWREKDDEGRGRMDSVLRGSVRGGLHCDDSSGVNTGHIVDDEEPEEKEGDSFCGNYGRKCKSSPFYCDYHVDQGDALYHEKVDRMLEGGD